MRHRIQPLALPRNNAKKHFSSLAPSIHGLYGCSAYSKNCRCFVILLLFVYAMANAWLVHTRNVEAKIENRTRAGDRGTKSGQKQIPAKIIQGARVVECILHLYQSKQRQYRRNTEGTSDDKGNGINVHLTSAWNAVYYNAYEMTWIAWYMYHFMTYKWSNRNRNEVMHVYSTQKNRSAPAEAEPNTMQSCYLCLLWHFCCCSCLRISLFILPFAHSSRFGPRRSFQPPFLHSRSAVFHF